MACGTPVVACPTGAAVELVDDGVTGYLRSSIDELVDAVASTGNCSPSVCRRYVDEHFSASVMVERYERLFTATVAARELAGSARVRDAEWSAVLRNLEATRTRRSQVRSCCSWPVTSCNAAHPTGLGGHRRDRPGCSGAPRRLALAPRRRTRAISSCGDQLSGHRCERGVACPVGHTIYHGPKSQENYC